MTTHRIPRWLIASVIWLVAAPVAFGYYLQYVIQAEYASGERVSTDGDTPMIPLAGFILVNTLLVLTINIFAALLRWVLRSRKARTTINQV